MKVLLFLSCLLISSVLVYSQQASDYFPSQIGFDWEFKGIPLDTVNNPINDSTYRMDSFLAVENYNGKLANIVVTKSGPFDSIWNQPYLDSLYYSTDGTNGFEYFDISSLEELLFSLDSAGIVPDFNFVDFFTSLQDWYPVYQFGANINTEYVLVQVDTSVFISPFTIPIQFKYLGTRLQDQTIQTVRGSFDCKKFLISWKVSANIFGWVDLLTTLDTIWIAPDNWIVQDIIPGQNVVINIPGIQIDPFAIIGLETKLTDEIVSVNDVFDSIIPDDLVLEQNYPNPFNPSTTVKFSLPSSSYTTLKIYNALGEEVAELINKDLTTGTYEFEWNASGFTSGVYFYQLKTDGYVETRKMILMK